MTPVPVTPRVASTTAVGTGGTAVVAFTGPVNGFYLANDASGATAMTWSLVGTAGTTVSAGTVGLAVNGSVMWTEPLASGVQLSVNCGSAQSFNCIVW